MALIARLGDSGSHGGSITSSASKTSAEGNLVARVGDIYNCPLHGPNPIVKGAGLYKTEGKVTAVHGSLTACGATIIAGSAKSSSPLTDKTTASTFVLGQSKLGTGTLG